MASLIASVFWIALGVTTYNFLVYPWLLWLLSRWRTSYAVRNRAGDGNDADQPLVSIILPTEGDASTILDRLQNLLEMDYPADRLEIVVGCNEQDSLTLDLVATINDPRVCAVRSSVHCGRNGIINECLDRARGEIVLLTDCSVKFERQTLSRIAAQFHTPHVGAVCGRLATTYFSSDSLQSHTERRDSVTIQEIRFGIIPKTGSLIAAFRAELLRSVPERVSDAGLSAGLTVYRSGLAIVFEPDAVASVRSAVDPASDRHSSLWSEFRNWTANYAAMMRVAGVSLASIVLLSHLLRRWAPVFAVAAMISNAMLAGDPFFLRLLLLHEFAYLVVLVLRRLDTGDGTRWQYRKTPPSSSDFDRHRFQNSE